jgi:hypothetical protein
VAFWLVCSGRCGGVEVFGVRQRRSAVVAAMVIVVLGLTACSGRRDQSSPAPGPSSPASAGVITTKSGAPAGAAGDPCVVLQPAEVQGAIGQTVRSTQRLPTVTTAAAVSQQCQFEISGAGISYAGMSSIAALADSFVGQKVQAQRDNEVNVAMIEVAVADLTAAATGSSFPSKTLPAGAKRVSGIGQGAVVVSMSTGSIGAALINPHKAVYLIELEGRAVPQAQMEKLLRAAVTHAG